MFDDFFDLFDINSDDFDDDSVTNEDIGLDNASGLDSDSELSMQEIDLDGDGLTDGIQYLSYDDSNGDGIDDTLITETQLDSDFNGVIDTIITETESDTNGDGYLDSLMTETAVDEDENGTIDLLQIDTFLDSDDDNEMDYSSTQIFENIDGEGLENVFSVEDFDIEDEFNAIPGTDFVDDDFDDDDDSIDDTLEPGAAANYETYDPSESDPNMVIGNPAEDASHWHSQETNSTCAVASQEFVLEELTGQDFNESDLTEIAQENGWYDNGTPPECVGNILEYMGLSVERSYDNDISDIEDCLNNGGKVIVGLDSSEVWDGEDDDMGFGPGMDADHAVQVTGIDYTDPDNPMVILNDSGVANGAAAAVPLDDFVGAWEDGGCYMVEAYE